MKDKKIVMNFITRERVYRFSKEDYSCTTWALFLYRYFPKEQVDVILNEFDIRIDTRFLYKGGYGVILPFKNAENRIRDVRMMLTNPATGRIVKGNGDDSIYIQKTSKQFSHAAYEVCPFLDCYFSIGAELAKGYTLKKIPTPFGLNRVVGAKEICIVTSPIDAVIMSIIYPYATWIASGYEGKFSVNLYHPYNVRDLQEQRVPITLFPEYSNLGEAHQIADYLIEKGVQAKVYQQTDILGSWDYVGDRRSVATIALKMLELQFSYSDVLIALKLVDEDKVIFKQNSNYTHSTKLGLRTHLSNVDKIDNNKTNNNKANGKKYDQI